MLANYKISEEDIQIELIQAKKVLKNEQMKDIHDVIDKLRSIKAAFPELLRNIALTISVSRQLVNVLFPLSNERKHIYAQP